MSFLTPLYVLAVAAVSLPIMFHLIRRTPRGRHAFSSLMFLTASPPRLTRRSRLEHLLLLLLRALALALLAFAFARPFFREAVHLTLDDARARRLAIVVDASASMRRSGVWQQAGSEIERVLSQLETGDEVAYFVFDDRVQTVVDFQPASRERQMELVRHEFSQTAPTWGGTNLGLALVTAADALTVANDLRQSDAALQIVLISDLQRGARLDALQAYDWPQEVAVSVKRIAAAAPSNATLRVLTDGGQADSDELRVKVTNSIDSAVDQFRVGWEGGVDGDQRLAIYVPPGQNRVIRLSREGRAASSGRIVLKGDDAPFDNVFHTVPLQKEQVLVAYLGDDQPDDPDGLRYYLELALADTFLRQVEVVGPEQVERLSLRERSALSDLPRPELVVAAQPLSEELLEQLEVYIDRGGCLLVVLKEPAAAVQLANFVEEVTISDEAEGAVEEGGYVMLSEIDFSHPLFSAFAQPQYNDFTKIHFWNHVRMQMPEQDSIRVLARFDDGSPALWEKCAGDGKLIVITSGWDPLDSQLALSTKFVPLLTGILEQASGGAAMLPGYTVHDRVALPADASQVTRPDGQQVQLPAEQARFSATDLPGVYQARWDGGQQSFAVNLASAESETSRLDGERLEQLGVQLGTHTSRSEELKRQRQLRDIELEGRQKVWRWLIVAAMGVLLVETCVAGRFSRVKR